MQRHRQVRDAFYGEGWEWLSLHRGRVARRRNGQVDSDDLAQEPV
jgi:hypothetical protein